jgi:hypothetical protein
VARIFLEHPWAPGTGCFGAPIILNLPPFEEGPIWISSVRSFFQWSHTWNKVYHGASIPNQSGTITVSGFTANKSLKVEWWNTYTGTVTSIVNMTTSSSGSLTLSVDSLKDDVAVKIGNYTSINPSPNLSMPLARARDPNNDGKVARQAQTGFVNRALIRGSKAVPLRN